MNLKEMVIKNNPKLKVLEINEVDGILLVKVDNSVTSWKAVQRPDFYYNAYMYLADIKRIKVYQMLGFSYKKGGIVGITSKGMSEKRDKEAIIQSMKNSLEKYNKIISKLGSDQFIRTIEEYYKISD